MPPWVRAASGSAIALLAGAGLLAWATDGFAVLTTDAARARSVARAPVIVPVVAVRNSAGVIHDVLADRLSGTDRGDRADRTNGSADPAARAVIVDFVYTSCTTLCSVLGSVYQELQREILVHGASDRVRLLTVSFDVAGDTPERLARYGVMLGARADIWNLATPTSMGARDTLLRTFGVQVVPAGNGEWQHNAALHIVSPQGKLVRIVEINDVRGALAAALAAR